MPARLSVDEMLNKFVITSTVTLKGWIADAISGFQLPLWHVVMSNNLLLVSIV